MTGEEAWSLISPIIAPHGGVNDDGKIDEYADTKTEESLKEIFSIADAVCM